MEEFWNAIDAPAKHSSEMDVRKSAERISSQNRSIYEEPHHDLKVDFLKIPLSEIRQATNNFNEAFFVGDGGYADVYRAELDVLDIQCLSSMEEKCKEELPKIRKTVAIKKFKERADEQGKQGFLREIQLLTCCKHPNIISLLGFSEENNVLVLVYEFALNGSLADYFRRDGKNVKLTWGQRLQICLDTANGINYLHTKKEGKPRIIHRDIKSDNILLDENLNAKVADFGLSKLHPIKQQASTIYTKNIAGTEVYLDPEYLTTSKYKKESDVYSFGVVLFEVLFGMLAYDPIYLNENRMGLAPIVRSRNKEKKLKEMIDPKLIEEVHNDIFIFNRELNQDSFDSFIKIACQCLAVTQAGRPTFEVIIKELQKALNVQKFKAATNKFSTILSATNNFSNENLIAEGALGKMYRGQLLLWNGNLFKFTVRRLNRTYGQGVELQTEISTLKSLEHRNIITVLGHYDANDEKIIIYEQGIYGTLDQHLSDPNLTWPKRLQICLGVARALNYIRNDVIHCDINSSKIILDEDREPKIYGFELSTKYPQSWRHRYLYSRYFGTKNMTPKYDVYSFGMLMLEVLCGRKPMITNNGIEEELDKIIDPNLWEQISTQSLALFKTIAYNCLNQQPVQRPTMNQIVKELEEVLSVHHWENINRLPVRKYSTVGPGKYKIVIGEDEIGNEDEGTSSDCLKVDFLEIPLSKIRLATKDFDEAYCVGSSRYGLVYKANLDVLDIQCLSSMEGKCKDELPRINKTVAIMRMTYTHDIKWLSKQIELRASFNHTNIISLLGFSIGAEETIFVYEYAFKGSLGNSYLADNLTWAQRIKMCVDIASGIKYDYIFYNVKGKSRLLRLDIRSDNILLDENLIAKVSNFGLSRLKQYSYTEYYARTRPYLDQKCLATAMYPVGTEIYSFGVVLFEVLSGRVAYDSIYRPDDDDMGLARIARRQFNEGTLKDLIDPKMFEDDDLTFSLNREPNQDSLDAFSKIAYQCLEESQYKRPPIEVVIKELQNALSLQGDTVVLSRFLLHDILLATENFAETYCIGLDTNGMVYKAELDQLRTNSRLATEGMNRGEPSKKHISVAIKRVTNRIGVQGKQRFLAELELRAYKLPNIVSLIGICDEDDELILVYEHASGKSLDDYLKSIDNMANFTWTQRLHMSLEIARGLNHLHNKMVNQSIIRTDIKSTNILLDKDRQAKIGHSMISKLHTANEEIRMKVYEDPQYETTERRSDIYSFGVVLFEIFCGRVAYDPVYIKENDQGLAPIACQCFNDGTTERILDPRLKEEMGEDILISNNNSLDTFLKIASRCLGEAAWRPTIEVVIKQLERALHFQDPSA